MKSQNCIYIIEGLCTTLDVFNLIYTQIFPWWVLFNEHLYLNLFVGYQAILLSKKDSLLSFIECPFGLMDKLFSQCIVSGRKAEEINHRMLTDTEQNLKLIETMIEMSEPMSHEAFRYALRTTYQNHLAKYIAQEGGRNENIVC